MMRKVIKPVAGGYCEEVWEYQGRGGGKRRSKRPAPYVPERSTGGRLGYGRRRPSR